MRIFDFQGDRYQIVIAAIDSIGDLDWNRKIVYIHPDVPEDHHEGFSGHEIIERKLVMEGHTHTYAHNRAQEWEIGFYDRSFGNGKEMIEKEERIVQRIFNRGQEVAWMERKFKGRLVLRPQQPFQEAFEYGSTIYRVDNTEEQSNVSDVNIKEKTIYIDKHVPRDLIFGECARAVARTLHCSAGHTYQESYLIGMKRQREQYISQFGDIEGQKKFDMMEYIRMRLFKRDMKRDRETLKALISGVYPNEVACMPFLSRPYKTIL